LPDVLLATDHDGVRLLTFNRPGARNSLSVDLIRRLSAELRAADADPEVRAVVLTGADPAFCAGLDLEALAADGPDYLRLFHDDHCIRLVGELATPVVGAVNGAAFTGGLEIALGCDFLVASERAVFADTHARVGVLPDGGMTARLPDHVGTAWARRMSLTSEVVDADLALRIGLVTEVVPHEQLVDHALGVAARIADGRGDIVRSLKHMYAEGWSATTGAVLHIETRLAAASTPNWGELESNRRAVLDRNRAQLG
jgi:enoyl-CoA hydratase